jgi:hypothetical protein
MGTKHLPVIHRTAKKSFWSGRITALCGATEEAGQYETTKWRLTKLPGQPCPACELIAGQR